MKTSYGLGIKAELEGYYNEEVNTGRVYDNLDKLVENGYLEKSPYDQRTNSYTLTDKAIEAMKHRYKWQKKRAEEALSA